MTEFRDRVFETSLTTGSGNFTLDGAVTGYRSFNAAFSVNDQVWYVISHRTLPEYEIGLGTVLANGVLQRANSPVLSSAPANAKVNFSAGKKEVRHTLTAATLSTLETGVATHASTHATGGSDPITPASIGAAAASHTQAISTITGLQDALDGKSIIGHGHSIAAISGLQDELDAKSAVGHTHTTAAINGFDEAVDDRIANLLVAGSNVTLTYNDAANTLTIASTGGGGGGAVSSVNGQTGAVTVPTYRLRSAPTDGYFYLLVAGQSNAQGSAGTGEGDSTIDTNIQVWRSSSSTWITPVYGSTPFNGGAGINSVNVGVWAANYLQRSGVLPGGTIVRIIPNWLGGEPIEGWVGSGTSSARWTELLAALSDGSVPRIDHAIWFQGEANNATASGSNAKTLANYETAFNTLVAQLRGLSQWTPTTGLSVSMLGQWGNSSTNDRNDFFHKLQSVLLDPYISVVSSVGCTPTNVNNDPQGNNSHFNGTSLQLMGQRHAEVCLHMMNGLGAKRLPLATSTGTPQRWRNRKDVSGDYFVSQDDLANEAIFNITGNATIYFPDLNRFNWSGAVIIDKRSSTLHTVTLRTTTNNSTAGANGVSQFDAGNNVVGNSIDLYSQYRNTYRVVAFPSFWRVEKRTLQVGSSRRFFRTVTGNESQSDGIISNVINNVTAAATITLPSLTSNALGAMVRFVNNCSNWLSTGAVVTLNAFVASSAGQLMGARSKIVNPGTGYVPTEVITIAGGTATTAGTLTVATTQVVSATVAAGGSGGTNGTQTVTGTTGLPSGSRFQAIVTVSGGAITAVQSISNGGSYTTNPTTLSSEPVTGAGLTGASLSVVMGVATLSATTAGAYTVLPSGEVAQASTSGSGTGATFVCGWRNTIRGINPRLYQMSRTITKPGDQVIIETSADSADVLHDTSREGATHRLVSGTLSTQTMTSEQMLQQRAYQVAANATITLPLATLCEEGSTLFWSVGPWALACQSRDTILGGSASGTSISMAGNAAVWVHAQEAGQWVIVPAPSTADNPRPNQVDNGEFAIRQRNAGGDITVSSLTIGWPADRWVAVSNSAVTLAGEASQSLSGARPVLAGNLLRITPSFDSTKFSLYQTLPLEKSVALRGARVTAQFEFRYNSGTPASQTIRPKIAIVAYNGTANGSARLQPFSSSSTWAYASGFTELASAQLPSATPGDGAWRQVAVTTSANVPDDTTHLLLVMSIHEDGFDTTGSCVLRVSKFDLSAATGPKIWQPTPPETTLAECLRHYEQVTFVALNALVAETGATSTAYIQFPISRKSGAASSPAVSLSNTSHWRFYTSSATFVNFSTLNSSIVGSNTAHCNVTGASSLGSGMQGVVVSRDNANGRFIVDAENAP